MKTYQFKITLIGTGNNTDEAWFDATESFMLDPGITPDDNEIEEIENDEEEE